MPRLILACIGLCLCAATWTHAEVRTLTDQFGRTITADVLELDGDTLKIRRDDGVVFDLPIGNLSVEDQKSIRQWAAKQPKKVEAEFQPNPEYLPVGLSRVKLSSSTMYQYEGYKHAHEMWGYSIQITNKHLRPIQGLRVEYNLHANTFADLGTQRPVVGTKKLDDLRSRDTTNFKTEGTEVCKRKSIYTGNSGGEMKGIWIRVYVGDKLVHDMSSPENLKESVEWIKPGSPEDRQSPTGPRYYYY